MERGQLGVGARRREERRVERAVAFILRACEAIDRANGVAHGRRVLRDRLAREEREEAVDLERGQLVGEIVGVAGGDHEGARRELAEAGGAHQIVEQPEHRIPMAPTLGIVAYTPPSGARLHSALRTPLVNMRPDGGGRFLLRSNELDRLLENDEGALPSHPQAQELIRRAAKTIPALAHVPVEAVRIATRPIPKDAYSAVGPVPGLSNYYAVVTHSGVTLGAFLGEVVADELVNGRTREERAEFRPRRFFN